MKRYSDTVMKLSLIQGDLFEDMMEYLRETNVEIEKSGEGFIAFIQNPNKKLFKYKDCFRWLSGCSYLWYEDKPITMNNYMDLYWVRMTNEAPVSKEDL